MIKIIRNVFYRTPSNPCFDSCKHKLDIYIPQDRKKCPVIMYIHGGAWSMGDCSDDKPRTIGKCMARKGYVTCVISYRLAKIATCDTMEVSCVLGFIAVMWLLTGNRNYSERRVWMLLAILTLLLFIYSEMKIGPHKHRYQHPAQIQDCAAAFDWIKDHIEQFSGNPNHVTVMGHSAGAHLATLLVSDRSWLARYGRNSYSEIHSIISISGAYSHIRMSDSILGLKITRAVFGVHKLCWNICFPLYHLQQNGKTKYQQQQQQNHPPIFLINCEWEVGLKAHAIDYYEELVHQGVRVKQISYKHLDHLSIIDKLDSEHGAIVCEMDEFIRHPPSPLSS